MQIVTKPQRRSRKNRTPNFPVAGTLKPYGLYPVFAMPVLPGETLQSLSFKHRTLSKPIKHPLGGCWGEHWLVYVKFTDLDRDLGQSFINDTTASTAYDASSSSDRYFTKSGQIDWIRLCCERVHDAYFVNDDETPQTIDGVRKCKLNNASWYQNMIFKPADEAVPTVDSSDMYEHLQGWMMLQQANMTELTYEKYLETYGVRQVRKNVGDPEILRFARSWVQPVNTVEPSTGTPSSAWAWSDEIKMSKGKRFDEPGFVLMLACYRPKMFQENLRYSMIGNLWGFSDWYPSYNLEDPTAGVKKLMTDDAVFAAAAQDTGVGELLYDHRDLLSHGEQFVNDWTNNPYDLPMSAGLEVKTTAASSQQELRGEYPDDADIEALFSSTASASDSLLYYEGIAQSVISGHIEDTTN